MPIPTWRNVPVPDFATSSQAGVRTAADLLSRAVGHASTGVAQIQQIEDRNKAAEKEAADRYVLQNMLAIQDPTKYREELAAGNVVGPAQGLVSPDMLLKAEARQDSLQGRADANVQRENAAVDRALRLGDEAYNRDRTKGIHQATDQASAILAKYSDDAVYSPQKAMSLAGQELSKLGLPAKEMQDYLGKLRSYWLDTSGQQAVSRAKKQDELDTRASDVATRMMRAADPQEQHAIWTAEAKKDPTVAIRAQKLLQGLEGRERTGQATGSDPTFGLNPDAQQFVPPEIRTELAENSRILEQEKAALKPPVKAILNSKGMEGLSAGKVATQLAGELKKVGGEDVDVGKITSYIRELGKDHPKATPAQIGALLQDHIQSHNLLNFSDIASNLDTNWGNLKKDVAALESAGANADKYERKAREAQTFSETAERLAVARRELEIRRKQAGNDPASAAALAKAEEKYAAVQKKMDKLRGVTDREELVKAVKPGG